MVDSTVVELYKNSLMKNEDVNNLKQIGFDFTISTNDKNIIPKMYKSYHSLSKNLYIVTFTHRNIIKKIPLDVPYSHNIKFMNIYDFSKIFKII